MVYTFQSMNRSGAIQGIPEQFANYELRTESEKSAKVMRSLCEKRPHEFWETTPEVLQSAAAPKQGRPEPPKAQKVIHGARGSDSNE